MEQPAWQRPARQYTSDGQRRFLACSASGDVSQSLLRMHMVATAVAASAPASRLVGTPGDAPTGWSWTMPAASDAAVLGVLESLSCGSLWCSGAQLAISTAIAHTVCNNVCLAEWKRKVISVLVDSALVESERPAACVFTRLHQTAVVAVVVGK